MFGLYFANLLFYVTGVVMVIRGLRVLRRKFTLSVDVERVAIAVCAAALAPALASLGHVLILVPFALYPRYHIYGREILPINIGLCIVSVIVALYAHHRRTLESRL